VAGLEAPVVTTRQAEAVALYRSGVSIADACAQMKISQQAFYNLLRKAGEPRRRKPGSPKGTVRSGGQRDLVQARALEIVAAYEIGTSIEKIACDLGVGSTVVSALLGAHGFAAKRITPQHIKKWVSLYTKQRLSTNEIAKRSGFSQASVHRYLQDLGVLRPVDEATGIAKRKWAKASKKRRRS
jgi:transposase